MTFLNEIDAFVRANLPAGAAPLYERAVQFLPLQFWVSILAIAVVGWPVWKTRAWWLNWTWVQKCRNLAVRRALPKAEIFSIAIASLEGDEKDSVRTQLLDALRGLAGVDVLRFDRKTSLANAANPRLAEAENHKLAQSWLAQSKAHVLIWGQVMPASGQQSSTLRLHFTTRDTDEQGSIRLAEQQVFEFPVVAQAPLAAAVRAQVLAQLAKFPSSHPVAQALQLEIALLQKLVDAWPKGLERAAMQVSLGNSWETVGSQTGQAQGLHNAITAYQEALKEYTRERVPLDWAMTQNNLGIALSTLGERDNHPKRLEAAVTAYQEALKERTRERVPLGWAATQNNLGTALGTLGERDNHPQRLEAAVSAFQEALKERTRERAPLGWAMTQNNLGNALRILGERDNDPKRLEEAVTAYQEALKERTRERVPLDWAATQNNLGTALGTLGERDNHPQRLEAAVSAFQEALKEHARERAPLGWAMTQNNLGTALRILGERNKNPKQLEEAVTAYQEALKEYTRERVPLDWAGTQNNLGTALGTLGALETNKEKGIKLLEAAIDALKSAISEFEKLVDSYDLGIAQSNLKRAEEALAAKRAV